MNQRVVVTGGVVLVVAIVLAIFLFGSREPDFAPTFDGGPLPEESAAVAPDRNVGGAQMPQRIDQPPTDVVNSDDGGVLPEIPAEARMLHPNDRRTAMMAVGPAVHACVSETGVDASKLDPRFHARVYVAPDPRATVRVRRVEIANGEAAPPEFIQCILGKLELKELDLPEGTTGLVVSPPLVGHPAPGR